MRCSLFDRIGLHVDVSAVRAADLGLPALHEGSAEATGPRDRGCHRALRVAHALANLDGGGPVGRMHVAEALAYRGRAERRRLTA